MFVVRNSKGLHTRPSAELVKCAAFFQSHIQLRYGGRVANAKSLLEVLILCAAQGAHVEIEAEGDDADIAVGSLLDLCQKQFGVDY